MKKILFISLSLFLVTIGCEKETTPDSSSDTFFFECEINGETFRVEDYETLADNLIEGRLTLTLREGDQEIYFIINDYDAEATYTDNYMSYTDLNGVNYYGEGEVIITKIQSQTAIEGTFSGTADDLSGAASVTITNGAFRLKYF